MVTGNTDIEQLSLIFGFFGTPIISDANGSSGSGEVSASDYVTWTGVTTLPNYIAFEPVEPDPLNMKTLFR